VVKARVFVKEKEVEKEVEEKRKYNNRVKRAANALKRQKEQEEKEARAATRQLVTDLKIANLVAKRTLKAQAKLVAPKAKKSTPAMLKARKTLGKAKQALKSLVKRVVRASIIEGVASRVMVKKTATRTIREPQRYIE
jgi:uncharacterized protein YpuA (DUF1002 family)